MALGPASSLLAALAGVAPRGVRAVGRRLPTPQGQGVNQQLPLPRLPGRVAWGGQQFSDLPSLMAWIAAHGGNPQQVLANHPGIGTAFGQRGTAPGAGALGAGIAPQGAGVAPIGQPGLLAGLRQVNPTRRRLPRPQGGGYGVSPFGGY
jgi:hypothetical protein